MNSSRSQTLDAGTDEARGASAGTMPGLGAMALGILTGLVLRP